MVRGNQVREIEENVIRNVRSTFKSLINISMKLVFKR